MIWLHGLGADGSDFESMTDELDLPERRSVEFLYPHAPFRAVTINGGMRMRAWYDIATPDLIHDPDIRGIEESAYEIEQMIGWLEGQGIEKKRVFVAGFSQGGAVALCLAQRVALAGVIVLSSYGPTLKEASSVQTRDIWIGHGDWDPVVPRELGHGVYRALKDRQCAVVWRSYPMGHSVCGEEIRDLSAWLSARMEEIG